MQELAPELHGEHCEDPLRSINETERALGVSFPAAFRALLLKHGGALMFKNGARFRPDQLSGREATGGVLSLLSLYGPGEGKNSLLAMNRNCEDDFPSAVVAIGDALGGDRICFDGGTGQILFWRHDADDIDSSITLISDSYDDFVARLFPDPVGFSSDSDLGIDEDESFLDL